ncbi:MAG: FtsQ-type POTRA domain-containing protein [Candidatus Aminicenantes bacterium]|nr:MAG: FtsQ-type POTRA domain-containing protein [Candidatus Aminicenantes bacterium]
MARHINLPFDYRTTPLPSQPMQFQRGKGKVKTKKIQRKIRLKFKHIFFFFLLLGGIFYLIQRSYLFLISWDHLNVKRTEVLCSKPEGKGEIQQFFDGKKLGNILLLDIGQLQEALTDINWVKDVQIRKVFPSSLKIKIKERHPAAVLKKEEENLYLIDKEGVELEKIDSAEYAHLPLLIDSNNFEKDYNEKLEMAWECLGSLPPSEKEQIEALDLTDYGNVTVQLKETQTKLILGSDRFSQKFKHFQSFSDRLEPYGALEYVDLRIHDRLFFKPKKNNKNIPEKEVN